MNSITQRDRSVNRSPVPASLTVSAELVAANSRLLKRRLQEQPTATHTLRQANSNVERAITASVQAGQGGWLDTLRNLTPSQPDKPVKPQAEKLAAKRLTLYPTLAAAFHKAERVAEARLWLLCRAIDTTGRGWLPVETIRNNFAKRESKLRIAGWRRVRQLLQAGRGVFWERDTRGRVWLYSAEKVAHTLGVTHFSGTAVLLPIAPLLKSLRSTKAHFYAAFHSGRDQTPVSRSTISKVTGVPERTQRNYDKLSLVARQANIALGPIVSEAERQTHFAQRAGAFEFIDKQGKQGKAGTCYQAWQLPNSYGQIHKQCGKQRQKRANRRLKQYTDLAIKRAQGNGVTSYDQQVFFAGKLPPSCENRANREFYYHNVGSNIWYCGIN